VEPKLSSFILTKLSFSKVERNLWLFADSYCKQKKIFLQQLYFSASWFAKHETPIGFLPHPLSTAAASFVSLSKHPRSGREKYLFKLKGPPDHQECANIELHMIICPNNKCGLLIAAPRGPLPGRP
jgi:hypothetical protein